MIDHQDVDLAHMDRCLELATAAGDAGDTPVGSVIVRDGVRVGEGQEAVKATLDPSAHAELLAIRAACRTSRSLDLSGATLYTTVEPCFLCAFAIRATRIRRVVIGVRAGEVGALHSRYPFLSDPGFTSWGPPPEIQTGVRAEEAAAALRARRRDPAS